MKIDLVSDISCPWCAIGLHALEQALRRVAPHIQATLHVQPFELNPAMAAEGEDIVEHLAHKYGISAEQIAANTEGIRQRGAALGFTFSQGKRSRIYNTFEAHRLLHWAGLQSPAAQLQLKHALFAAYFTEGLNPGDHAVLRRLVSEIGLDVEAAQAVLSSHAFADEVRQAQAFYQQQGIRSVPAVIINDRHLISGGQPVEVFEQALRQIAAIPRSISAPSASAASMPSTPADMIPPA
ncbi:MAG: DsbA family oxidoreductase [Leptothrix ochracea]|uniref:DsbA family oxidoreductase n=1 Tax=Leptothrix ochracea TaxID=735331 RepID=UPI0034E2CD32